MAYYSISAHNTARQLEADTAAQETSALIQAVRKSAVAAAEAAAASAVAASVARAGDFELGCATPPHPVQPIGGRAIVPAYGPAAAVCNPIVGNPVPVMCVASPAGYAGQGPAGSPGGVVPAPLKGFTVAPPGATVTQSPTAMQALSNTALATMNYRQAEADRGMANHTTAQNIVAATENARAAIEASMQLDMANRSTMAAIANANAAAQRAMQLSQPRP